MMVLIIYYGIIIFLKGRRLGIECEMIFLENLILLWYIFREWM